jgi:hypothetical protein
LYFKKNGKLWKEKCFIYILYFKGTKSRFYFYDMTYTNYQCNKAENPSSPCLLRMSQLLLRMSQLLLRMSQLLLKMSQLLLRMSQLLAVIVQRHKIALKVKNNLFKKKKNYLVWNIPTRGNLVVFDK